MKDSPFNGIHLKAVHTDKWVAISIKTKEVVTYSANLSTLTKKIKDNKDIIYVRG